MDVRIGGHVDVAEMSLKFFEHSPLGRSKSFRDIRMYPKRRLPNIFLVS